MLGILVAIVIGSIASSLIFSKTARDLVAALAILSGIAFGFGLLFLVWASPAILLLAVAWFLWSRS